MDHVTGCMIKVVDISFVEGPTKVGALLLSSSSSCFGKGYTSNGEVHGSFREADF